VVATMGRIWSLSGEGEGRIVIGICRCVGRYFLEGRDQSGLRGFEVEGVRSFRIVDGVQEGAEGVLSTHGRDLGRRERDETSGGIRSWIISHSQNVCARNQLE